MPLGSLSACAYVGTVNDDEGLQSLTLFLCQNLRASCQWDLSSACAYVGTVNDDGKAPIPDPVSLPESSGPHAIGISYHDALMSVL